MTPGQGARAAAVRCVLAGRAARALLRAPGLVLAVAALPPAMAQPATAPAELLEWRVQPGDTLIGLGRRLLIEPRRWPELARSNGLRDGNRIANGTVLRIPRALVRSEAVPAELLAASGQVQGQGGAPLQAGARLDEGAQLHTGADGNATVRLVDGTVLRLRADSRLSVHETRRYPGLGQQRSSVQLEQGRVEVRSPRSGGGQPGFEVRTPQGVLGVRGTEFRVAAEAATRRTLGEVLEGAVGVAGARGTQHVAAGYGSVVDAAGTVAAPVALLPAPDLAAAPRLQQRVLVRFDWPALAGAAGYRGQVARDAGFDTVLADITAPAPLLRVAGLPDGDYVLRLRASDALGLEGQAAEHAFTLKARPEAPLPVQPAPGARLRGSVDFRWSANPEAALYGLQVARDPGFTQMVLDRRDITTPQATAEGLAPGRYHWRLTSLRTAADAGPPGDALAFDVLLTPPPAAPPGAAADDLGVSLNWTGEPGQQFELQVARDAAFADIVLQRRLERPGLRFEPPGGGRFHVRMRTIEADGYVGPYGAAQFFDVPPCLRTADRACVRASGAPVLTRP